MRKFLAVVVAASTVFACNSLTQYALADGTSISRSKKLRHASRIYRCAPRDLCGFRIGCPDGTCYSLYGAYGPYGGPAYWTRYTYDGWGFRW